MSVRRNSRLKRNWQPSERDSSCVAWIFNNEMGGYRIK